MAHSGIEVDPEVMEKFKEIKDKKKLKYVIFRINDEKTKIIVDDSLPSSEELIDDNCEKCFAELCTKLTDDKPRYVLYDVVNKYKDGRKLQKLVFIAWCSDNCKIGLKMLHASTKDALKKKLTGIMAAIQASDKGDLDYEEIKKEAAKGK